MDLERFGLRAPPFALSSDEAPAFPSRGHREAVHTLAQALEEGAPFVQLTGEGGTGKTLACRRVLDALRSRGCLTAYLPNPCLSTRALYLALARALALPIEAATDEHALRARLGDFQVGLARSGQRLVLCLDEAHAMPLASLDALRELTPPTTRHLPALQVVLCGRPELGAKLALGDLRPLAQRVASRCAMRRLTAEETVGYVAHRLRVAGCTGAPMPFTSAALNRLHAVARGTPRLINRVAHKALLRAGEEGASRVGVALVVRAARETPGSGRYASVLAWGPRLRDRLSLWRERRLGAST